MKNKQVSVTAGIPAPIPSSEIEVLLTSLLKDGLTATEDSLFFMESTYGVTAAELETTINDHSFEDRHVLLNLFFSPTRSMREQLEPLLQTKPLGEEHISHIAGRIAGGISEVRMHVPDCRSFCCAVDDQAINHFVDKCYMDRQLDPIIAPALQEQLSPAAATRVKVLLRCRNLIFSEQARRFMMICIARAADRVELFESVVELLLDMVSQAPARLGIVEYLFEQREFQKKRLNDIEEFAQRNKRYGLEYLLMQNYPIPHESEENVTALLHRFNRIIDELLDLQNPKEHYIDRRDLGAFAVGDDLGRLFRSLS
ncbi:MAG: hypothetical protein V2I35_14375 [Desulfocapsaceae bacterium]|nr:hypothetical protein [Desulfocapsaceae bacterium]